MPMDLVVLYVRLDQLGLVLLVEQISYVEELAVEELAVEEQAAEFISYPSSVSSYFQPYDLVA